MSYHNHNFCGQLCWVCSKPIMGEGIVANCPEAVGATTFHWNCYQDWCKTSDKVSEKVLHELEDKHEMYQKVMQDMLHNGD